MATRETQSSRLDRIEDKIDKMTDAIVQLARVEEKIADLEERREEQHERMNRLSRKIDDIDANLTTLIERVSFMQRVSWVVIAIFLSAIATHFTDLTALL